jgi:hypothetical protein
MPGTCPGMTEHLATPRFYRGRQGRDKIALLPAVMAGLVPAIHALGVRRK